MNREEFTPYGETSFGSFAGKRYRYTGKERDEETGFAYYGFRYYAFGLGRWTSADPASLKDGLNLYRFTRSNPVTLIDLVGTDSTDPWADPNPPNLAPVGDLTKVEDGYELDAEGKVFVRNAAGALEDPMVVSMKPPIASPVAAPIFAHRLALQFRVKLGHISNDQASKMFRDFIKQQVYSNQLDQGSPGFCAAATRQMALKHAGVIRLGLSYGAIKRGLATERSDNATTRGEWEQWHFNENVKGRGGAVFFSHKDKLDPDDIAQIARNAGVGAGSTARLQWTRLDPVDARRFLDEGAMIAIGTSGHWMTAVHDPFANKDLIVDPMADNYPGQSRITAVTPGKYMSHPLWGSVLQYHGLARLTP